MHENRIMLKEAVPSRTELEGCCSHFDFGSKPLSGASELISRND